MKILIKKPSQSKILWMLLLLAFLKPAYFGTITELDKLFNGVRILVVLFMAFYYVVLKKKMLKFSCAFFLFSIVPLLSTFLNSGNVFNAFAFSAVSFGSVMIMELGYEKDGFFLIDALYSILEILVYANLVTMLMFPHGLYLYETSTGWISDQAWILGLRNAQTTYLILACIVDVIYWRLTPKKRDHTIRCCCLYFAVFITINTLKIGSGYIGYALMTLLLIITAIQNKVQVKFHVVAIAHIIIFFLMTSLGKLSSFAALGDTLGLIVGRTNTVSARFRIWSIAWDKILSSPIWGYGILNEKQLSWLSSIAAGATTTHNTFLDMWFRGGVLCFGLFCLVLFLINRKLLMIRDDESYLYNVCGIGFLTFFIVAQAEGAMSGATMYILIGLLWVAPDIVRSRKWN